MMHLRFVSLTLGALAALAACGDDDHPAPPDPRFAPLSQAIAADLAGSSATAASVAVWLDGEIVWVGGFGTVDPAVPDLLPGEETQFNIGSDTKKITAISLLRAIGAGQATLESRVGAVLPNLHMQLAPTFATATIRQLLSHQGGIADAAELTTSTTDAALASYAYGELAATYPSLVPPGTFWNYANPNFSIAGLVDQELSGRPWADIVEQDLFEPLGMDRTVARRSEVDADHCEGNGYGPDEDGSGPVHRIPLEATWESAFVRPAGLVWSTPSDQMKLARFLVDGDASILDPALLSEVTRAQVPMYPDLPGSYGFGLMVAHGLNTGTSWYDVPLWWHGGNTRSHTSTFYVLPEQRFAISILSNGVDVDFTNSVITAFTTLAELPPAQTPPGLPFVPSQLDALLGTYTDTIEGSAVEITRAGDALQIRIPDLDAQNVPYDHTMTAVSTHIWTANIAGAVLDFAFITGPDGVAYMRNREIVLARSPAPVLRTTRAARLLRATQSR